MSTAISMPSPVHGGGCFGAHGYGDLSPAFRNLSAAVLQQRAFDLQRMRELARSDEFSDDESDGEEDAFSDNDDDQKEEEEEEDEACGRNADAQHQQEEEEEDAYDGHTLTSARLAAVTAAYAELAVEEPRSDLGTDSEIDSEEMIVLPFYRPSPVHSRLEQQRQQQQQSHQSAMSSPMGESSDWTIVDKSPTLEGPLSRRPVDSWFVHQS